MCERVIYLKQGQVLFDGPTDRGIEFYEHDCRLSTLPSIGVPQSDIAVTITQFELTSEEGTPRTVFARGERMRLRIRYESSRTIARPNFIIAFIRSDGVACCNFSSVLDGLRYETISRVGGIELLSPPVKLVAEMYSVHILIRENEFQRAVGGQIEATFHVRDEVLDTNFGVFHQPGSWVGLDTWASEGDDVTER